MKIIDNIKSMQQLSTELRKNGLKIACVPTMGYLHEGHLSLIKRGKELADVVVTTLFVNPTQFGPTEDFSLYPRDFDRDVKLAQDAGCDIMFVPENSDIYPTGFSTNLYISGITEKFEGEFRPGHFDGVALIVAKLFNAVLPDIAVFGQKDFQQTLVIKKMSDELNFPIDIIVAPTIREENGLAKSSRNKYLTDEQKEKASIIFKALNEAKLAIESGERDRKIINAHMIKTLRELQEIKIQYSAAVLADDLSRPAMFLYGDKVALMIACYIGKTRLIDNILVTIPSTNSEHKFLDYIE